MFKQGSSQDEIYRSMEKTLVKAQIEGQHGFDKVAKAIDLLNVAAAIFEQAGMQKEAAEITEVLNCLAKDLE